MNGPGQGTLSVPQGYNMVNLTYYSDEFVTLIKALRAYAKSSKCNSDFTSNYFYITINALGNPDNFKADELEIEKLLKKGEYVNSDSDDFKIVITFDIDNI